MTRAARASAHDENIESFEQSFQRLQEVVQRLSEGNLTLQEALASFEEGMALTESCSRMLDEAELRVKQISERALRAGQAAIAELEGAGRTLAAATPIDSEGPELVTFEVETYETTLVYDRSQEKTTRKNADPKSSAAPKYLDPLFDEDD